MASRSSSVIKVVAIVLAILAILMKLGFVIIPILSPYEFWLMVIAFGLALAAK